VSVCVFECVCVCGGGVRECVCFVCVFVILCGGVFVCVWFVCVCEESVFL